MRLAVVHEPRLDLIYSRDELGTVSVAVQTGPSRAAER